MTDQELETAGRAIPDGARIEPTGRGKATFGKKIRGKKEQGRGATKIRNSKVDSGCIVVLLDGNKTEYTYWAGFWKAI